MSKVTVLSGLSHFDKVPRCWKQQDSKAIKSTADNAKTFTLYVLSSAGFGKSYPFKGSNDDDVDPQPSKYRYSLSLILDHIS